MQVVNKVTREDVYKVIDSERDYQEMRVVRDSGAGYHTVEEYLLYMEDYLNEARKVASRTWGSSSKEMTLDVIRKVTALGVVCMEQNGAPIRKVA